MQKIEQKPKCKETNNLTCFKTGRLCKQVYYNQNKQKKHGKEDQQIKEKKNRLRTLPPKKSSQA